MATNRPLFTSTTLVNTVATTLSDVWNLEVLCPCLDGEAACREGACLSNTIQALGISMTVYHTSVCALRRTMRKEGRVRYGQ